MSVKIAGIEFDNVDYDAEEDILYVHVGDPASAVAWDESPEGDGLRFGIDGSLVGITILNARGRVDADGEIAITLPQQRVVVKDLGGALTRA